MARPLQHPKPKRIAVTPAVAAALAARAEQGLPHEVCGLLLGPARRTEGVVLVDELSESPNLAAAEGHDRFEIDPELHLRLRRELRGTGRTVLGLYHSHPNGTADASRADHMGGKLEPGLIWLIVPVVGGRAAHPAAYWATERGLVPVPLDYDATPSQQGDQQQ